MGSAACNCPSCQRGPALVIQPGEAGYRFSDKSRSTGAVVPPEVACRCVGTCDREGEDAQHPCRYCRLRLPDPVYSPCPRLGFGCGPGCDCCTPAQQEAASV